MIICEFIISFFAVLPVLWEQNGPGACVFLELAFIIFFGKE